ncbi:hypothetical protein [Mycolicibacterium fluoranthenivorans]|uniref:Phage major capsid protein n=1 Tax=Mycolicibacterium fluoranthenivorans TaxID=258505 RepID=A0A1G4WQ11_9MYCO|nr:hypothetical protein [Mycolicibacterium fluoranthenivorans]SCX27228.1 hypothetical protein SAMN02799620_04252 [Mycolicibacterium fluoranthenivorans]
MPDDLETLIALPASQLDSRLHRVASFIETRSREGRDLTQSEVDDLSLELANLRVAVDRQQQISTRGRAITEAIDSHRRGVETRSRPTLLVSESNLREHAAALAEGRPFGAVETRSRVTAGGDLGSAGAWHPGAPQEPRHVIAFAGIPVSPLTGRTAQVPSYTGPTGAAGVDEGVDHGEYDSVNPVSLTALRYGRWSEVSALADQVDELTGLNQMHAWGIARDLDKLAVAAVEGSASFQGVSVDIQEAVRTAVLHVSATVYAAETQLVIVGQPADLAELTGTQPANADDLGSYAVRFAGARLYPTLAASPNLITVFAPSAYRTFQSPLQSASLIDPQDGSHKFGSWLHSTGVAQQIAGSAVTAGAS